MEQLAAAYLKAATAGNKVNDKAWRTYKKSPEKLANAKRLFRTYAKSTLTFIRAVQAIPWTPDTKPIARRLLSCDNQVYILEKSGSKAANVAQLVGDWNKLDRQWPKCSGIANELRLEIGLPPVPID